MIDFIKNNHLDLAQTDIPLEKQTNFDVRAALGSKSDFDHVYNQPRAWITLKYLNPNTYKWDDPHGKYHPESNELPWCLKPEKKITIEDVKYVLSNVYNGTKWNCYNRFGDQSEKGKYRYIGINRTNFTGLTQIRGYMPDPLKGVEWIALGCMAFCAYIPQYARINTVPKYLNGVTEECNTEYMYWQNRLIACLTDAHFQQCNQFIDHYQLEMGSKGHFYLNKFDKEFIEKKGDEKFLEDANQQICDVFQKRTGQLLDKVLFTASNQMKNSFSRSDA
jgi:dipeptidase